MDTIKSFTPRIRELFQFEDTILSVQSNNKEGYYLCRIEDSNSLDYFSGDMMHVHETTMVRKIFFK